jgi:hypothetical protein
VKDENPVRTARRKVRQLTRLGSDAPICFFCGCPEIAVLRPVSKRFLEDHHPLGDEHDPDLTVPLCRNCHYRVTEQLSQSDVSMLPEPDPIKRVEIMLRGSAVHHEELAAAHRRMADLLKAAKEKK